MDHLWSWLAGIALLVLGCFVGAWTPATFIRSRWYLESVYRRVGATLVERWRTGKR